MRVKLRVSKGKVIKVERKNDIEFAKKEFDKILKRKLSLPFTLFSL